MELHILWLYHDVKDVFGDAGNLQVLKKRCEKRDIACHITTCGIGEDVDMMDYDLVYFGTNIQGKDTYVMKDLMRRKGNIKAAIEKGIFFFLVCGGFQAFGKDYLYDDETIEGLQLLTYQSDYRKQANCIGNVYISSSLVEQTIIGFENHQYQILQVEHPLGNVMMGKGNDTSALKEGYFHDTILGTNLHGPLLPKNPQLADVIIQKALQRRYEHVQLSSLADNYEEKAREAIQKRFKVQE